MTRIDETEIGETSSLHRTATTRYRFIMIKQKQKRKQTDRHKK